MSFMSCRDVYDTYHRQYTAKIGLYSFPVSEEKAIQIKSLQVLNMCNEKGYSITLPDIQRMFKLKPNVSSDVMFKQVCLAESLQRSFESI